MSDDGSHREELETVVIVEAKDEDTSSVEAPMSEWSSLVIELKEENPKRKLFKQGLYDPGSGEICTAYVAQSDSEVLRHPYYNYPSIPDPGIEAALLQPPPKITYPNDGQDLYLATCEEMNQCPVRIFHRSLLSSHINLSYYGVNPNGVRAMAMALQNNSNVTHFDLTDNWLNDDACFHLGQMLIPNATLTELNLNGCCIGPSGVNRLSKGLPTNRALQELNLSRNQLGDEGLEHLAHAIMLLSDIRKLNLSFNSITGAGARFLGEALETQNKLTSLDLSFNNLYSLPSGLCSILEQLGTNPNFEYINLAWNYLSGSKVAAGIKGLFPAKNLLHIDLSNNKFCGKETIVPLIAGMTKPKKMVCFNLSYNPLSPEDAVLVVKKFQQQQCKVKILNLDGVTVDKTFINALSVVKEAKPNVEVTHGYVKGITKFTGPDPRELVLSRIEYLGKKNKKKQMDIALVVLQLIKDKVDLIEPKDLSYFLRPYGVSLDEDLLNEVQNLWPGPPAKKGGKRIDLKLFAEFIKRKWPNRKLPPTPPPEPEPEPEPAAENQEQKA